MIDCCAAGRFVVWCRAFVCCLVGGLIVACLFGWRLLVWLTSICVVACGLMVGWLRCCLVAAVGWLAGWLVVVWSVGCCLAASLLFAFGARLVVALLFVIWLRGCRLWRLSFGRLVVCGLAAGWLCG